jgi:hypothetical protein
MNSCETILYMNSNETFQQSKADYKEFSLLENFNFKMLKSNKKKNSHNNKLYSNVIIIYITKIKKKKFKKSNENT